MRKSLSQVGEEAERELCDILVHNNLVAECHHIGPTHDQADVKYRLQSETIFRGIQVKVSAHPCRTALQRRCYPPTLLLVVITRARDRCWMFTQHDAQQIYQSGQITTGRKGRQSVWARFELHTVSGFIQRFKHYSQQSTPYVPVLSPTHKKEQWMIAHLQRLCTSNKWTFSAAPFTSSVDGLFNGQRAQLKYSSSLSAKGSAYQVALFKRVQRKAVPYCSHDFDVLVVMLGDVTELVYVIPMYILEQAGVVTTESQKGATCIYLQAANDRITSNRFYRFIQPAPLPQLIPKLGSICDICHATLMARDLTAHQSSTMCRRWI